ncbi:EF hand domain containing protein [Penicillium brasilianum]|uniref:EF hand domain containing protein n=1 Tax=Penicillium brasilianum TaxID=104259 RepID=A0A1S9RUZ7_PENBI|nr:EF hand domain containing protein [Penicillium brasilianum]
MISRLILVVASALALSSGLASAHGSHSNDGQPPSNDWATRHMMEEHHIEGFDALSFFTLHDYDASDAWTPEEVRKTYGLDDESNRGVSESSKESAIRAVFDLFDPSNTGTISRDAWLKTIAAGTRLPDLGYGPGHHGDLEYEYEIHHFEKFHGDDATEEELNHPQDIEHFRLHDELEAAQLRLEKLEDMQVVEANIPSKFRRAV